MVYYSATGSTQAVAQTIADATGGDLFEIVPAEPYTSDDLNWRDNDSRVSKEHDDPSLRDVALTTDTVDNWDDYDTVFIGYPIWWGIASWPVDTFVKANDFAGLGDTLGTIEAGKCADMIVTRRNPLEKLDALRQLDMVVTRGRRFDDPKAKKMEQVERELDKVL